MTNTFLPENYELPTQESRFTKFEKEKTTKIRILKSGLDNDCIVYWEYFQRQNDWKTKPVRSKTKFSETPWIEQNRTQKEVWSFKVYNYDTNSIQICSIWQKGIKEAIMRYIQDTDFGNPLTYDLKISRKGEWLETQYWVIATPPKEFDESLIEWKDVNIDWIGFLNSEKDIFFEINN